MVGEPERSLISLQKTSNQKTLEKLSNDRSADERNIIACFLECISSLNDREQNILSSRAGVGQAPKTLEEIGSEYSVTRERIRQIEAKALKRVKHRSIGWNRDNVWDKALNVAFQKTLSPVSPEHLATLDERFETPAQNHDVLFFIVERALNTKFFRVELEGKEFISRKHPDELIKARKAISSNLAAFEGCSVDQIIDQTKKYVLTDLQEFIRPLVMSCLQHSILDLENGEEVLKVYSDRRSGMAVAKSIINASQVPLSNDEIRQKLSDEFPEMDPRNILNRLAELPGVFPFSHGTWGTIRMLDVTDEQINSINDAVRLLFKNSQKEQIHSIEVLKNLTDLGLTSLKNLDEFTLSGILRYGDVGRYLGRNVFATNEESQSRINIHDIVVSSLRKERRPLHTTELKTMVEAVRSFSTPVFQPAQKGPLILIGKGFYGLNDWLFRTDDEGIYFRIEHHQAEEFIPFRGRSSNDIERPDDNNDLFEKRPNATLIDEKPTWDDEKIKTLTDLWRKGNSISSIAAAVGLSRNAVAGKAHRLGLPKRKPMQTVPERHQSEAEKHQDEFNKTANNDWSNSELRQLISLNSQGISKEIIARTLNKPVDKVVTKLAQLQKNPLPFFRND